MLITLSSLAKNQLDELAEYYCLNDFASFQLTSGLECVDFSYFKLEIIHLLNSLFSKLIYNLLISFISAIESQDLLLFTFQAHRQQR